MLPCSRPQHGASATPSLPSSDASVAGRRRARRSGGDRRTRRSPRRLPVVPPPVVLSSSPARPGLRRRVRRRQNSSSPESTSSPVILVSRHPRSICRIPGVSWFRKMSIVAVFCPLSTPLMGRPFRLSNWRRRFPILPAQSLSILQHFPSFQRSTKVFRSRSWTKCKLITWPPLIWRGSSRHLLAIPSLWRGRRSWTNTRSADGATCLNRLAASSNKQTPNLL